MIEPRRAFWERRAEQELDAAQEATDTRVVRAHFEMLGRYLDLLYPVQRVGATADPSS